MCRAQGEEVATNNGDTHNIEDIGDIGESMHTAHCKGPGPDARFTCSTKCASRPGPSHIPAFDAVVRRTESRVAESEFTVPAEEQYREEATANRENTLLQASTTC